MEKQRTEKTTQARAGSTITINGKLYDAASGRALDVTTRRPLPKTRRYGSFDVTPARAVHSGPARSETLKRDHLPKPAASRPVPARHTRSVAPVPTHPLVSRFGRPADATMNAAHVVSPSDVLSSLNRADSAEQPVGFATQVQNYSPSAMVRIPAKKPRVSKREAVVQHQLHKAPTSAQKAAAHKASESKNLKKRFHLNRPTIITGVIVLVILLGVVSYLSIPALSLFVAAKSAGVEATYPNYVPAGYHFKGPVTYHDGEVSMSFRENGGSESFQIIQQKSYWDSGAVLDNYVLARAQNYLTYSEGGITVYTFGSQAAWMNAGVLHAIDGNAHLTSEQILRIAGSM